MVPRITARHYRCVPPWRNPRSKRLNCSNVARTSPGNEGGREAHVEDAYRTTNDASANLTLRQIDLSRNPIVACCMFSRVRPFLLEMRSHLALTFSNSSAGFRSIGSSARKISYHSATREMGIPIVHLRRERVLKYSYIFSYQIVAVDLFIFSY